MAILTDTQKLENEVKHSVSDQEEASLQGEDYYQMVSEAAYYLAEKRDFADGHEMEDWMAAEAEIQALQKNEEVA